MIKQEYLRFKWGDVYYYRAIDRGMWKFHGPWYFHHTGAGTLPILEVRDQSIAEKAYKKYYEINEMYSKSVTTRFDFLTL